MAERVPQKGSSKKMLKSIINNLYQTAIFDRYNIFITTYREYLLMYLRIIVTFV